MPGKRTLATKRGTGLTAPKSRSITGDAQEVPVKLTALARLETPPRCAMSTYEPFDFEDHFLPFIDFSGMRVGTLLGSGRNGDVFESTYEDKTVAVKQFDITKNFDSYKREVEGYKYLKSAWGDLVPTPIFISSSPSGNVRYLAMTKGQLPNEDKDISDALDKVLDRLRTEHKFDHLDSSHGRNCILVSDGEKEKLLVVDLEHWEEVV
jgi:hypothetical protein